MLNLVADRVLKGRIYPALSQIEARPYTQPWREFGRHWPYTTPLRVQEYCDHHAVEISIFNIQDPLPPLTYYPICLAFFSFDIDYIDLLPPEVYQRVKNTDVVLLFMYHEGDHPQRIKNRLDMLCQQHGLATSSYVFLSSNSMADRLPNFVTFHDFELWYYQRNREHAPLEIHRGPRTREFTCLSRTHKWWRAAVVADMSREGLLDQSYWSYCEVPEDTDMQDLPIEIDMISRLRWDLERFTRSLPKYADDLTQEQRNDHAHLEPKFFQDAWCNLVLESQFDVDQSGGAFITEKTFKPIKHGQMFFIAGGPGSLQVLRDLGYRVFDHVLDNSYDLEPNHTQRWIRLRESIQRSRSQGLEQLFDQCRDDIEHNQKLFTDLKTKRLNTLIDKIHEKTQRLHLLATT